MAGWRAAGWRDGWSENAVRLARFDVVCRFARFAVFAVHRGGRFLAVRFRFAVRFTAFLKVKWKVLHHNKVFLGVTPVAFIVLQ